MSSGEPLEGRKEPQAREVESSGMNRVQDDASSGSHEHHGTAEKVVHADGTVDYIDHHAIGGEREIMPKGYFRSPQFIGTVTVRQALSLPSAALCN